MSVFNNQGDRGAPSPERRSTFNGQPAAPAASAPVTSSYSISTSAPAPTPTSASAPAATAPQDAARKVSVLGKTLVFKGELSADEDIILQGRVEGSIHHTQSVTVGIDGVVIGDTHARSIVVEGTVEGDLKGVVSVLIAATATVRGNISAPRVGIMEGANFNGSVDMSSPVAAVRGSDAYSSGASADVGLSDRSVDRILAK
jgi:cytoskeletal protein CcmA (bactofilin family)